MKIVIFGTGYVGLVSGACFAEVGNHVTCIDVDTKKIERLKQGQIPIYEPGLEDLVQKNVAESRLTFTTSLESCVNEADICFIAVGTPPQEDGSADLSHVLAVASDLARVARRPLVVGTKSTVPVGTGDRVESLFKSLSLQPITVFSNPEFLKEGNAVNDFLKPDRIIVGVGDESVLPLMKELYAPFTRQKDRLLFMSRRSAELTKYAANAMLATRISFINEMANLCEKVGANINDIRVGIGSDGRIGSAFLFPGMGYGGSCFPKDVKAILKMAKEHNVHLKVIDAVEEANLHQQSVIFKKIVSHFGDESGLKGLTFALWGLAFKANTDDIRESAALKLAQQLIKAGAHIRAYDPQAMRPVKALLEDQITLCDSSYDCVTGVNGLIIATEWNEFRSPDYEKIKNQMKSPVIFDGRNIVNRQQVQDLNFIYYGIGLA